MPPLQATEALYQSNRRRALKAMLLARREWAKIDPTGDWFTQWQKLLTRFAPVVYAAQIGAATDGSAVVAHALAETGHPERQLARVQPKAFAGWVSPSWLPEGRVPLLDYLQAPVTTARNATGPAADMLATGGKMLEGLVQYAVADASAHAHDAQVAQTRNAYSVFVEPGSMCKRCAVLVGKRYKPGTHVKRHPRCDGVMEAHSDADPFKPEPVDPSRVKDLTVAQREEIAAGADFNKVINSRRTYVRRAVRPANPVAAKKAALDLSAITSAKTPQQVAAALQDVLGTRGTVSGFDAKGIATTKAAQAASQIARLADKYPEMKFNVAVEDMKPTPLAAARNWNTYDQTTGKREYTRTLLLSRTKLAARSNTEDMLKRSTDAGWWSVRAGTETDAMTYSVTHEFGHLIDYQTGNSYLHNQATSQRTRDAIDAWSNARALAVARGMDTRSKRQVILAHLKPDELAALDRYEEFIASQVSGYGRTNSMEGIAEAFADVEINGDRASEANKLTVRQLIALLRGEN